MLKKIWRKWGPNPFECLLKRVQEKKNARVLIVWNRGLGDIALGLYAMVVRIRTCVPHAEITFLTRSDLAEGFKLLENVNTWVAPDWKRGSHYDLKSTLLSLGKSSEDFDLLIEKPDPTHWVRWQLGTLTPKLRWKEEWDALCDDFPLSPDEKYIAMQPQTETLYGYEKNWPLSHWRELIEILTLKTGKSVLLLGKNPDTSFVAPNIIDLRGKTTLLQMLSLIKNRCSTLIVPDSGVLSLSYFLDTPFPLKILSLWADPRQGVLKQNVSSPNPLLTHIPLLAKKEDLRNLSVSEVLYNA